MNRKIANVHPEEILQEDFLIPLHLSQYRISMDIKVPPRRDTKGKNWASPSLRSGRSPCGLGQGLGAGSPTAYGSGLAALRSSGAFCPSGWAGALLRST
jgi:hypothetical protein